MVEQVGPKRLWTQLKAEAPRYAKLLPELPRLVHDFLKTRSQPFSTDVQVLIQEQRRTQRMLSRVLWTLLGFVLGMLAMQLIFHAQFI
jgi:ubiquinone biosynthesis protein